MASPQALPAARTSTRQRAQWAAWLVAAGPLVGGGLRQVVQSAPDLTPALSGERAASDRFLGSLGLVTAVTLDVGFSYEIEQHVYDDLPLDLAVEQLGMIMHAAYSVSIFTSYAGAMSGQVGQVWLKRRTDGSTYDAARNVRISRRTGKDI